MQQPSAVHATQLLPVACTRVCVQSWDELEQYAINVWKIYHRLKLCNAWRYSLRRVGVIVRISFHLCSAVYVTEYVNLAQIIKFLCMYLYFSLK